MCYVDGFVVLFVCQGRSYTIIFRLRFSHKLQFIEQFIRYFTVEAYITLWHIAHCFADSNRTNDDHQQQNFESKVFEAIEHQPTEPSIQSGITNSKQIKVKLIEFRFKLLFLSPSRTEFYSEFEILLRWWITKSRIWNCETLNSKRMGIYFIGPPWS